MTTMAPAVVKHDEMLWSSSTAGLTSMDGHSAFSMHRRIGAYSFADIYSPPAMHKAPLIPV